MKQTINKKFLVNGVGQQLLRPVLSVVLIAATCGATASTADSLGTREDNPSLPATTGLARTVCVEAGLGTATFMGESGNSFKPSLQYNAALWYFPCNAFGLGLGGAYERHDLTPAFFKDELENLELEGDYPVLRINLRGRYEYQVPRSRASLFLDGGIGYAGGNMDVTVSGGTFSGDYSVSGTDCYLGGGLRYMYVKAFVGLHVLSGKMKVAGSSSKFSSTAFNAGIGVFIPLKFSGR